MSVMNRFTDPLLQLNDFRQLFESSTYWICC